jgi:hypothetical protein
MYIYMYIYIYVLYSHRSSKHHEMVLSSTSPRFFAGLSDMVETLTTI